MTSTLPAIELNFSPDGEYTITAMCRESRLILAAAMSYDCEVATVRIDLQLIELGYDVYAPEDLN